MTAARPFPIAPGRWGQRTSLMALPVGSERTGVMTGKQLATLIAGHHLMASQDGRRIALLRSEHDGWEIHLSVLMNRTDGWFARSLVLPLSELAIAAPEHIRLVHVGTEFVLVWARTQTTAGFFRASVPGLTQVGQLDQVDRVYATSQWPVASGRMDAGDDTRCVWTPRSVSPLDKQEVIVVHPRGDLLVTRRCGNAWMHYRVVQGMVHAQSELMAHGADQFVPVPWFGHYAYLIQRAGVIELQAHGNTWNMGMGVIEKVWLSPNEETFALLVCKDADQGVRRLFINAQHVPLKSDQFSIEAGQFHWSANARHYVAFVQMGERTSVLTQHTSALLQPDEIPWQCVINDYGQVCTLVQGARGEMILRQGDHQLLSAQFAWGLQMNTSHVRMLLQLAGTVQRMDITL